MQEKGPPQRPHGVLNTLCYVWSEIVNHLEAESLDLQSFFRLSS